MNSIKSLACASVAGLLLLGGCAGGNSPLAPAAGMPQAREATRTRSDLAPDAGAPKLYVSDLVDSIIYVYSLGNLAQPRRIITKGIMNPQGLAVDYSRQLYVANQGTANDVTVYPPGKSKPSITYQSQYFSGPDAVAIGKDGTVYVSNYSNGTVVEFPPGQQTPSLTITLPGTTQSEPDGPQGLALDASNNLYVSYNGYFSGGYVEKYPPGSTSGTDTGIALNNVGGISIDNLGDIVLVDRGNSVVDVFPPGSTTPSQTIGGFYSPNQLAFVRGFKKLVVTDEGAHQIDVVSYPAGTLLNQSPTLSYLDIGVAVAPAAAK
jgi:6-phosphogluconolactonase (cycloisomerase 2 family)